jgi:hypothetical protein
MNINKHYTLAQSVNKFHYEIYTYTECKAQSIYTHNTGPQELVENFVQVVLSILKS